MPMIAFHDARRLFDAAYFKALHRCTGGNVTPMARLAGIGRAHVRRYLRDLGIGTSARSDRPPRPATADLAPVANAV
jgi:DNA-binding NtrC family response regulator